MLKTHKEQQATTILVLDRVESVSNLKDHISCSLAGLISRYIAWVDVENLIGTTSDELLTGRADKIDM